MKVSTEPGFILNEKDRKLLYYLFIHRAASALQIKRDLFSDCSIQYVYRRLNFLEKSECIERSPVMAKKLYSVFSITKKGLRGILELGSSRRNVNLKSYAPKHDQGIVDIKFLLSKEKGFVYFATENEIQGDLVDHTDAPLKPLKSLKSDGLLLIKRQDKIYNFAIEYERSEKSRARYESLFMSYYGYKAIGNVLYFVEDRHARKRILSMDRVIRRLKSHPRSKIFVTEKENFLSEKEELLFINSEKETINFEFEGEKCQQF